MRALRPSSLPAYTHLTEFAHPLAHTWRMTALEFLQHQLNDGRFQIERCYEGLDEAGLDYRPAPQAMSPREILEHYCECHQAFLDSTEGKKFSWGEYSLPDKSGPALKRTFEDLRSRAEAAIAANPDETTLKNAHAYLIAHDAYHVGQLALTRLALNPEWDPYSIYAH